MSIAHTLYYWTAQTSVAHFHIPHTTSPAHIKTNSVFYPSPVASYNQEQSNESLLSLLLKSQKTAASSLQKTEYPATDCLIPLKNSQFPESLRSENILSY